MLSCLLWSVSSAPVASAAGFDPSQWIPSWVRASSMAADTAQTESTEAQTETFGGMNGGMKNKHHKYEKKAKHRLVKRNKKGSHN